MVEHWHLRLKFRPASILDPRESFFSQLKVDIAFLELISGSGSRFWAYESQL